MTALAYPSSLPGPQSCTITAADRLAATEGASEGGSQPPVQATARQREYMARATLTFALSAAHCTAWMDWWRTVLDYGGAWFSAPRWAMPWGTGAVVLFASAPRLQHLGGGVRLLSIDADIRSDSINPAATPVDYADALELVALMRQQLAPMGSTPQAATVYASGTAYYVRPDTTHSATRNGLSYATAWGGFDEIVWASLGANNTLWVCGQHDDAQLEVGASGSEAQPLDIRLDHPTDPGSIYNSRIMDAAEWTASGTNGEYYITGIVSASLMLYEDGERLHGPSTSSRNVMNVSAVDTSADTIAHATERAFRLGDVVIVSYEGSDAALPGISTGGTLLRHTAYYAIPVSSYVTKLATSYANAIAGTAIDLTSAGDGSVWKVFHTNPDTHQDPVIGSLSAGQYQWDGATQRLYYKPSSGTPGAHVLRLSEERYSAIGSCIYVESQTDVRVFGGGEYGGLFGVACAGRVGLCHTNAVQVTSCERVTIDGLEVQGCRSGVAFVGGAGHVLRNAEVHDCGWHAGGGESPVTPETDILVERSYFHDIGQKYDFQDAQGGVINTNSDRSIVRRVLCQRIGRDHNFVNNGVLVIDTADDAHIYRCIVDDCYGEAFEMSLGANTGTMVGSSISSCIVWRHNRTPNTRTGIYEMGRAGCFQFPNNDQVGDKTHQGFAVFGNLVAGCRFPAAAALPNEVFGVLAMRPLYATAAIEDVTFRRNAIVDYLEGGMYMMNPRGASVPVPTWSADYNLFAGMPSGEDFYRLKITSGPADVVYSNASVAPTTAGALAGTWVTDTGNDTHSRWCAARAIDVAADLPPAVLELLRQDDQYDTLDAPTEALVGSFPFRPDL